MAVSLLKRGFDLEPRLATIVTNTERLMFTRWLRASAYVLPILVLAHAGCLNAQLHATSNSVADTSSASGQSKQPAVASVVSLYAPLRDPSLFFQSASSRNTMPRHDSFVGAFNSRNSSSSAERRLVQRVALGALIGTVAGIGIARIQLAQRRSHAPDGYPETHELDLLYYAEYGAGGGIVGGVIGWLTTPSN